MDVVRLRQDQAELRSRGQSGGWGARRPGMQGEGGGGSQGLRRRPEGSAGAPEGGTQQGLAELRGRARRNPVTSLYIKTTKRKNPPSGVSSGSVTPFAGPPAR